MTCIAPKTLERLKDFFSKYRAIDPQRSILQNCQELIVEVSILTNPHYPKDDDIGHLFLLFKVYAFHIPTNRKGLILGHSAVIRDYVKNHPTHNLPANLITP